MSIYNYYSHQKRLFQEEKEKEETENYAYKIKKIQDKRNQLDYK